MLPPEIIDHVLSFLQWDHETLKVCARSHPSLSELFERHFYAHLTVQNFDPYPPGAHKALDLLKVFADKPNIANQVRSLRLYPHSRFWDEAESESLESILSMVTQLQTISLRSWGTNIVWDGLCESFRTAFTNCLRLPTLTHVDISNVVGFPLSALDQSSSLRRLSLWGDFSYLPPSSSLVYPQLDFLNLCYCSSSSMEAIASWAESHRIPVRSLQLYNSLEQFSRLFGVCANTLTTLNLAVPSQYGSTSSHDPTPIPLSLSCLPHLARLKVQAFIHISGLTNYSCLPAIIHFLDTLPSPPTKLVHLIIKIDLWIDRQSNAISDTDWSPLISFPHFDVIPRVELQVRARKLWIRISSVELLGELKQDPQLMQLEMHQSFLINAVEEISDDFGLDK